MRVVCIDDSQQGNQDGPEVKKWSIYTVVDIQRLGQFKYFLGKGRPAKGEYYTLAETGDKYAFHSSLFQKINDDQQDETQMEREYTKEKVFS